MKAGHGAQMHSADGSLCRGGNSVACSARTDRPIKEGQRTPGWAGVKQRNLSASHLEGCLLWLQPGSTHTLVKSQTQ